MFRLSRTWKGSLGLAALFLAASLGQAMAEPLLVHQSTGDFYSSGGTLVACSGQGCVAPNFSIGNTGGSVQWSMMSQVFKDTAGAGSTLFNYTLNNTTLNPNLSSFSIASSGMSGIGTGPAGWAFTDDGTFWRWTTANPVGNGIAQTGSLGGFTVNLMGNSPLMFNVVTASLSNGATTTDVNGNHQWMGVAPVNLVTGAGILPNSPIPEPASLLLLGSGLAGLGAWKRGRQR